MHRAPTRRPASHSTTADEPQKSAHIRQVVLDAGQALRARHAWLRHQDAIGLGILILAVLGMALSTWAWLHGLIPWWLSIPATAFCASLTHELEHDLIHQLYFRGRPAVQAAMLMIGWLTRPNTVNPFVRRLMHLHHHKASGTASDLEERAITNGMPWGLRRLLSLTDTMLALALNPRQMHEAARLYLAAQRPATPAERRLLRLQRLLAFGPVGLLYYPPLHAWLGWHLLQAVAPWAAPTFGLSWAPSADLLQAMHGLDLYAVAWLLPNTLRGFCLLFMSSNLHYYGDVAPGNVIQQTQVLNAWWLAPLQLFCFNFGSTHAIHHFAVKEPFYIRQWTAPTAHRVMRDMGVRFNDWGSLARANRWHR